MISIIICSKQSDITASLKSNIQDTIGVAYELIVIDNSRREYSIFEAYNEGIRRASFDFCCFMHEDIVYHTSGWGMSVERHLSDPATGLIGVSGSYYLLNIPSPWFKAKPYVKNQIQSDPTGRKAPKHYTISEDKEVLCVDGFWFCSRKNVFEQVSFDTHSFTDFHFYDLDIAMQIYSKGYKIVAVSDITIEHKSGGSFNRQWLDAAFVFHNKWKNQLPATVNKNVKKKKLVNTKAFRDLLLIMWQNGYPITNEVMKIGWNELGMNAWTAYLLFRLKAVRTSSR